MLGDIDIESLQRLWALKHKLKPPKIYVVEPNRDVIYLAVQKRSSLNPSPFPFEGIVQVMIQSEMTSWPHSRIFNLAGERMAATFFWRQ